MSAGRCRVSQVSGGYILQRNTGRQGADTAALSLPCLLAPVPKPNCTGGAPLHGQAANKLKHSTPAVHAGRPLALLLSLWRRLKGMSGTWGLF